MAKGVRDFNSKWTIEGRHGFKNIAATEKAEFGENIIYLVGDGFVNPESVVTLWYEQHNFYDFENRRPNSNKSRTAQTSNSKFVKKTQKYLHPKFFMRIVSFFKENFDFFTENYVFLVNGIFHEKLSHLS